MIQNLQSLLFLLKNRITVPQRLTVSIHFVSFRLDVSNDLISLHIGDKILEVNGTPVKDQSIENIDKLIQSSDRVLQLTIEHDPHRMTKSCSDATTSMFGTATPTLSVCGQNKSAMDLYKCATPNAAIETQTPQVIVSQPTVDKTSKYTPAERQFIKNIVEAENNSAKNKQMKKTKNLNCAMRTNSLKEQKERCSSMSKLLDGNHQPQTEFYDLSRTKSFRVEGQEVAPRIFRASDLQQGMCATGSFVLLRSILTLPPLSSQVNSSAKVSSAKCSK